MNTLKIKKHQQGFTLIEVMVSVIVLAIGLLGMAGLQTVTLQNGQSAYMRSQATILAYDIMDRMRINRDQAINGSYDLALNATPSSGSGVHQQDLTAWVADLAEALPAGDGSVDCTSVSGLCSIVVQWDDTRATEGIATQQVNITARL
ncbi:type IV pilus modification protein PilV [Sedimenticola thiotaurini]|nr:type IV pilus modification protein PilV [Sedimenticola thiotaurini]